MQLKQPLKHGCLEYQVVATQTFFIFTPDPCGFVFPIWRAYFSNGLVNHQLVGSIVHPFKLPSLKLTFLAPENGWD